MDSTEKKNIMLIVDDEQSLYESFSPEDEFNASVKSYIRSKLSDGRYRDGIGMTVVSREPINEERFRSAASNWIRDEKASFRRKEKETLIELIGGLLFGSLLLILSIAIEKQVDVLKYSLLPIMGSLALGKAASLLAVDVPTIRVQRWFFNEIEENSVITFECANEKSSSSDKELV